MATTKATKKVKKEIKYVKVGYGTRYELKPFKKLLNKRGYAAKIFNTGEYSYKKNRSFMVDASKQKQIMKILKANGF